MKFAEANFRAVARERAVGGWKCRGGGLGGKRGREEQAGRKHDEPRDGTSSESHNICLLASCPMAAVGGGAWR
ncbi:MAG: hypothetical protein JWP03_1040 [Phycisphaerales bacterium]|nr:hypothetical protein [Phycisphaerales bacterium]